MLKERVITAIFLAVGFLLLLFFSSWQVFAVGIGIVLTIGAWEWADLSGFSNFFLRVLYAVVVMALAIAAMFYCDWTRDLERLRHILMAGCIWWAIALLWVQSFPSSGVLWGSKAIRSLMGVFVLVPAWLGCMFLHRQPDGAWLVFFVVVLIAAADIGAYFTGRAIGKRKLAPAVSPGKSWEGVFGGAVLAITIAAVINVFYAHGPWLALLAIVLPTALVSVLGDLLESMVKRFRGVKDSSQLLPGHGGVLDRIDGLVAAIPVFSFALLISGWQL